MKRTLWMYILSPLALAYGVSHDAKAEAISVKVAMGKPVMLADRGQSTYMKVGLEGLGLKQAHSRASVNLAVVLDRSGSMAGDKIEKAKEAALMVVDRLSKNDILSIIAYDTGVEVLVPATKVHNKEQIREKIRRISPQSSTALFAGVSMGIHEVRKFLDKRRVNRVLLLSDGQANVGPRSPNELGRLGASSAKEGIAITTIGLGLGYNEDLMTQLAMQSDGNHAFAENADQLAQIFNYELGDVLSVVAQEIAVKIELGSGFRPVRVLNRPAEIHGQTIVVSLNQLYANQEKAFLVELETPNGKKGQRMEVAQVSVSYANIKTGRVGRVVKRAAVSFSDSPSLVAEKEDREVMVAAVEAVATEKNRLAVALRDKGKTQEAQQMLIQNAQHLKAQGKKYRSKRLEDYADDNEKDSKNLSSRDWKRQRKRMTKKQYEIQSSQSY